VSNSNAADPGIAFFDHCGRFGAIQKIERPRNLSDAGRFATFLCAVAQRETEPGSEVPFRFPSRNVARRQTGGRTFGHPRSRSSRWTASRFAKEAERRTRRSAIGRRPW